MSADQPLLEVRNLKVQFNTDRGVVKAVDDVSYTIEEGETMGFVGESGAGKSVTGLSILDLIESPGRIVDGEVLYKGKDVLKMDKEELRKFRGSELSIVFQDSMTALNPAYTVGEQIDDVILEHNDISEKEARKRTIQILDNVQIPDAESRAAEFPHQFSGGMRQRALIAMALSCNPSLVIADEITTALDVTTEADILDLLDELQEEYDIAIQLITHDMGVVAETCDKVGVLYAGKLVEVGSVKEIFDQPRHPYTVGLMNALPQSKGVGEKLESIPGRMPDLIETPSGCSFHPRCEHATEECKEMEPPLYPVNGDGHRSACIRIDEINWESTTLAERKESLVEETDLSENETLVEVENLRKYFIDENQPWWDRYINKPRYVHAVDDVSFNIYKGETLGLVGESGCGKTTLGRTISHLYGPDQGTVVIAGQDLTKAGRRELRLMRSDIQVIFQDPFASLNPRRTVENIIGRPMEIHGIVNNSEERAERVKELLVEVGLSESHLDRYAHEFSGGQKQRIGIARALAVEPDFIICDEPVSALDVSVQAKILNLMQDLQEEHNLTYLFIAHNLNVVRHISDRIAVMYLGELVELGGTEQVFQAPYHPYTEILLSSIPTPHPELEKERIAAKGQIPSPVNIPSGCRFHTRCPYAMPECETAEPERLEVDSGHRIKCHLFDEKIMANKETTIDQIIADQKASSVSISNDATEDKDSATVEGDD